VGHFVAFCLDFWYHICIMVDFIDRWVKTVGDAFSKLGEAPPSFAPKSPEYQARAKEFGEIRAPRPLSDENIEKIIQELPSTGAITKTKALTDLTRQAFQVMAQGGEKNIAKTTTTMAKAMKTLLKDMVGTPEEAMEPVESIMFRKLPGKVAGQHVPGRAGLGSRLEFDPSKPVPGMFRHEVTHASLEKAEDVFRGKMTPVRRIMRQEAMDLRDRLKAIPGKKAGETGKGTASSPFYDLMPTEIHAYHLQKLPGESTKSFKDYERIFWKNLDKAITFSRRAIKERQAQGGGRELKGYPWE